VPCCGLLSYTRAQFGPRPRPRLKWGRMVIGRPAPAVWFINSFKRSKFARVISRYSVLKRNLKAGGGARASHRPYVSTRQATVCNSIRFILSDHGLTCVPTLPSHHQSSSSLVTGRRCESFSPFSSTCLDASLLPLRSLWFQTQHASCTKPTPEDLVSSILETLCPLDLGLPCSR
jgi:hypothetical protein